MEKTEFIKTMSEDLFRMMVDANKKTNVPITKELISDIQWTSKEDEEYFIECINDQITKYNEESNGKNIDKF